MRAALGHRRPRKEAVSAQKEAKQLLLKGGIWCIAHRQVHPGGLLHHAFPVGEGIKAQFAVVAAHAAVTHTSKAHPAGSQMDNGVVDAAPAKGDLAEEPLLGRPDPRKTDIGPGDGGGC